MEDRISAPYVARIIGIKTATLAKWRCLGRGPKGWIQVSPTHVTYPRSEVEFHEHAGESGSQRLVPLLREHAERTLSQVLTPVRDHYIGLFELAQNRRRNAVVVSEIDGAHAPVAIEPLRCGSREGHERISLNDRAAVRLIAETLVASPGVSPPHVAGAGLRPDDSAADPQVEQVGHHAVPGFVHCERPRTRRWRHDAGGCRSDGEPCSVVCVSWFPREHVISLRGPDAHARLY